MKLITRLPRAMRLTEHGAALAAAAGVMEDDAEAVMRHLRGQTGGLSGTVAVSALPALAAFVIAPSLPALANRHSAIRLVRTATPTVASLERGEADIAIGFVRPDLPGRVVRRLCDLQLGLYGTPAFAGCPPANWAFVGVEDSLGDIPQQRWLNSFAGGRPFALRSSDVTTQARCRVPA